ncbi:MULTISPECIES: PilW family protein [Solibacillus]|uniref:Prepilin-type N-terminal cleavage/methylation domain-containing protein n=1 Tax=Solibacillus merdavium TaxID=2762218 RepID=A0ABR8XRH0_9BACL|nr:prepilin-type N-terminal cleavage/methylation domain-containing protein [Solibacillus merdavium]MBD8034551.1 prepilin-type N-terminal cleavage/methylation domain-containing protein [Solibacillus merdavium]
MNNQKGLSLVELLAAIVIFSLIAIFATTILLSSIKTYAKINSDTILRDEADLVMANLIKEIYISKDSEIIFTENTSNHNYYIKPKIPPIVGTSSETGFKDNNIVIKGKKITLNNSTLEVIWDETNIKIIEGTNSDRSYHITLTLKNKNKNVKKTFRSEVRSINDLEREDEEDD